jgi:hypothetical protein
MRREKTVDGYVIIRTAFDAPEKKRRHQELLTRIDKMFEQMDRQNAETDALLATVRLLRRLRTRIKSEA